MTHVTCRLTAKNRDQLRNHTLGNRVRATFFHRTRTELVCNKSTQLYDAFIGHARQRHDTTGCSETRTLGGQTAGLAFGGTGPRSYRVRGVDGSVVQSI